MKLGGKEEGVGWGSTSVLAPLESCGRWREIAKQIYDDYVIHVDYSPARIACQRHASKVRHHPAALRDADHARGVVPDLQRPGVWLTMTMTTMHDETRRKRRGGGVGSTSVLAPLESGGRWREIASSRRSGATYFVSEPHQPLTTLRVVRFEAASSRACREVALGRDDSRCFFRLLFGSVAVAAPALARRALLPLGGRGGLGGARSQHDLLPVAEGHPLLPEPLQVALAVEPRQEERQQAMQRHAARSDADLQGARETQEPRPRGEDEKEGKEETK